MDHIHMTYNDWMFLKKHYDTLERYVLNVSMYGDEITIDVYDEKINDFLLDYRSMIVRKGMVDEQYYNDNGLRMKRIFEQCIKPVLTEEKK